MQYVKYQNLPSVRFFELDKFDLFNNPATPVAQLKTTYVGHQQHVDAINAINSVHSVYSPNDKEEIHFVIALSSINWHELSAIRNKDGSISFPYSIVLDELPQNHNLFLISLSTSIDPNYFYAKSKFENFLSLCLQNGIQIKVFNIKPEHLNLHPIYTTQAFFKEIERMKMLFHQFITPELKETVNNKIVVSRMLSHKNILSACLFEIKRDFVFDENSKLGRFMTPSATIMVTISGNQMCDNCYYLHKNRYYFGSCTHCTHFPNANGNIKNITINKFNKNINKFKEFWNNNMDGNPSYLHQLESKPSNLTKLWNNRHLESIDF